MSRTNYIFIDFENVQETDLDRIMDKPGARIGRMVAGVLLILGFVAGCASKPGALEAPRPGSGLVEYRQIAADAQKAVQAALKSLAYVSAQSRSCPAGVLAGLSEQVRELQVNSLPLRERAQAILARGDNYFANWHEELARVNDPALRDRAQAHRADLEQGFQQIRAWSQESREAFQSFLAALRKARNALEKDAASLDAGATREWLASAKTDGERMENRLASIQRELEAMLAMLGLPVTE